MPEVLFICTANQFRSPFAAACFQRRPAQNSTPGDWRVGSAGTWIGSGFPAHPAAQHEARQHGLDLSGHLSREVSAELLESADLVIVMEKGHLEALSFEFPTFRDHVVLLAEVAGEVPLVDVVDPAHSNFEDSDSVTGLICQYIKQGFEQIVALASARCARRGG